MAHCPGKLRCNQGGDGKLQLGKRLLLNLGNNPSIRYFDTFLADVRSQHVTVLTQAVFTVVGTNRAVMTSRPASNARREVGDDVKLWLLWQQFFNVQLRFWRAVLRLRRRRRLVEMLHRLRHQALGSHVGGRAYAVLGVQDVGLLDLEVAVLAGYFLLGCVRSRRRQRLGTVDEYLVVVAVVDHSAHSGANVMV